mmetsp:Transcript_110698/g.196093  ORF Transcript_110698/g.196093 Transcript_110698/m.196093 type:complete len:248 (-) Transcript_110698:302-1045(-)
MSTSPTCRSTSSCGEMPKQRGAYEAVVRCTEGEELVGSKELEQFIRLLQHHHKSMDVSHRALTAAWQEPVSLFSRAAEARAREHGVPPWAVAVVRTAQGLVDKASELGDVTDVYEAQLVLAVREGRALLRAPLHEAIQCLKDLSIRLAAHVPATISARIAFDEKEGAESGGAQKVLKHPSVDRPRRCPPLRDEEEQLPLAILEEKSESGWIPEWLLQMAIGAGRSHPMRSQHPALCLPASTTSRKFH